VRISILLLPAVAESHHSTDSSSFSLFLSTYMQQTFSLSYHTAVSVPLAIEVITVMGVNVITAQDKKS
jgi:hypothetical protein